MVPRSTWAITERRSRIEPARTTPATAARDMGFPVVLKIASPDIAHKTEVGGIALNLGGEAGVREAFAAIFARVRSAAPDARIDGMLVAPMAIGGVEVIMGVHRDPVFGPKMDKQAIVDALCRLSEFATEHADAIEGAEINPFLVRAQGGVCLDALIQPLRAVMPLFST